MFAETRKSRDYSHLIVLKIKNFRGINYPRNKMFSSADYYSFTVTTRRGAALSDSLLYRNYPRSVTRSQTRTDLDCDFAPSGNLPHPNFPHLTRRFAECRPTFLSVSIHPSFFIFTYGRRFFLSSNETKGKEGYGKFSNRGDATR